MQKHHMFKTLIHLKGNPRACVYTEPLWGIPFSLFIPYASLYMLALGVSKLQLGHIITIGMISQVIFSLIGGVITDKLGRKKTTFIFDIISWGIPTFIWAISQNYLYFAVAAAINGIFRVTANSWTCLLVEDAKEDDLVAIFSWVHITALAAGFFSPLSGYFVKQYSLIPTIRAMYILAFVSMMAKFIILNKVAKETERGIDRMEETKSQSYLELLKGYSQVVKRILSNGKTLFTITILIVISIVNTINGSFWSVIVTERIGVLEEYVGMLVGLKSIVMMVVFIGIIPRINVYRFKNPLLLGFTLLLISQTMIILAPFNQFSLVVLSILLEAVSFSLITPLLDSLQVVMIDKTERARIMAIVYTIVILVTAPFGTIAGMLSTLDIRLPFTLNLALIVIGFLLVLIEFNNKTKKRLIKAGLLIILLALFFISPFFQVVKSYAVMGVYSKIHEKQSFMEEEGISIDIPGGLSTLQKDYYPFVMTYDTSEEFSERIGEPIDLVVLYNFGAMKWLSGSSLMYDVDSPYYSGFYGAYVAKFKESDRQYGLTEEGMTDIDAIMDVTDFDLKHLVLSSIGDKNPYVDYQISNLEAPYTREIDGIPFQVYDANLTMDGMMHIFEKDYMAYIQYGRPPKSKTLTESFRKIDAYGRIYIYYDETQKISYFFYIIAPTKATIEETEIHFILKSKIQGISSLKE